MECLVNIYIKTKWTGAMKGSGTAAAVIAFENQRGACFTRNVTTEVTDSTKNRLNLQIVTKALHVLKKPCSIGIYMDDAEFIKNAIVQDWILEWKKNGWRNTRGKEIKNADVWKWLAPLLEYHTVGIVEYISTFDDELESILGGSEDGE
jgi:ribonuclease HI